jgi:hypothetical protein
MRFADITKTILIILIFVLLYFSTILTRGIQKVKDDWPQYRCVPTYMPLAGYIGKDPVANFSYSKRYDGFFLRTYTVCFRNGNGNDTIYNAKNTIYSCIRG